MLSVEAATLRTLDAKLFGTMNCRHVSFVSRSQANFVFFVTPKAETLERVFNESGFLIRRYHGARMANAVRISMPPASEFEQIQDILSQNLN